MRQLTTEAIILKRTDFGEADRILSLLTPLQGKISVIAKGVRKPKSKLAGGIELFSVTDITYIVGKGQVYTLTSSRLKVHFGSLASNLEASQAGFEMLKTINHTTGENPENSYFELVKQGLKSLNQSKDNTSKSELWFYMRLLWLEGQAPNLALDARKNSLDPKRRYSFDFENMAFLASEHGPYNASHIKLLRVASAGAPEVIQKVQTEETVIEACLDLVKKIISYRY